MVSYLDVTHITVRVGDDLRAAEDYYCALFDLTVSWREPVPDDAPFDLPWEALAETDVHPEIVLLHAGAFRLAVIESGPTANGSGPIDHTGLQVTSDQLAKVRSRVAELDLQ